MKQREINIVISIVDAIRTVLREEQVTFEEYRAGFHHLIKTGDANELGLLLDMFFNQTICDTEMQQRIGTRTNIEGPYFIEGAPLVDNEIKVRGEVEPLIISGLVSDVNGQPLADVEVDLWFASPDGYYSGYSADYPKEYFRGKIFTTDDGTYKVKGSIPGEYPMIRDPQSPTSLLINGLGWPGWRPSHLHQKYRKDGYQMLTTQAYFSGSKYLDNDPIEGVFDDLIHQLYQHNGQQILQLNIVLDKN